MAIKERIDSLKERPHHERQTIAGIFGVGTAVLLLLGWGFFFISGLRSQVRANEAAAAQAAATQETDNEMQDQAEGQDVQNASLTEGDGSGDNDSNVDSNAAVSAATPTTVYLQSAPSAPVPVSRQLLQQ